MTNLSRCPLFSGIAETDLPGMLSCLGARTVILPKSSAIFSEGDPVDSMGMVLSENSGGIGS